MPLSTAQLQTLKAAILSDPALSALPMTSAGAAAIADHYNALAAPTFTVWRAAYTPELKAAAIDVGITQLDALTASKRDVLLWWANRSHDARLATTQAAMIDMTGAQNTLKAALQDGAKRAATRAEKLFSTGAGSAAAPASSTLDGAISSDDVQQARELP